MMKISAFFALALSMLALTSQAQDYYTKPDTSSKNTAVVQTKTQPHIGLQAGTSVGISRYGASFNNFIAPYVSYQLNSRWSVNAGVGFATSRTPTLSKSSSENGYTPFYGGNSQQTFFYAQGRYQVNDRLSISGTTTYSVNQFGQSANNRNLNFNNKSMSVYAEYKISENFSFGVGGQISNGNSPYRYQPFGRNSFYPGSTNPYSW